MITQAKKLGRSASSAEGLRIIEAPDGEILVKGKPGSVTLSKHRIVEIPDGYLPEDAETDPVKAKKALEDRIKRGEMTKAEISILRPITGEVKVTEEPVIKK